MTVLFSEILSGGFTFGLVFVRLRAPMATDPYSGAATRRDWASAAEKPMAGFGLDPGGSVVTDTVSRTQTVTKPTLLWWGPNVPDVTVDDRLRGADGRVWHVTGNPSIPINPFTGWAPGASWPLELVEG